MENLQVEHYYLVDHHEWNSEIFHFKENYENYEEFHFFRDQASQNQNHQEFQVSYHFRVQINLYYY